MENLNNIKEVVVEKLKQFLIFLVDRKEMAILGSLGFVLVVLLVIVVIPNTQRNIRVKESAAMVTNTYKDVKKVEAIPYGELDNMIRKENAITVALIDPNDDYYEEFEKALKDENKMSEYEGKLYLYPLIYDQKKVTDFYKLKTGITVIHFENRQEVERSLLDSQKEIELYLVDHLNSLIRPSSKELEAAEKARKAKEAEAAAQKAADEEVIDELKNTAADDQASPESEGK